MLKLKIEKGVPIPARKRRKDGRGYRIALDQLKPTESVVLPCNSYASAWLPATAVLGHGNFKVAKVDGGYRVWRTK